MKFFSLYDFIVTNINFAGVKTVFVIFEIYIFSNPVLNVAALTLFLVLCIEDSHQFPIHHLISVKTDL